MKKYFEKEWCTAVGTLMEEIFRGYGQPLLTGTSYSPSSPSFSEEWDGIPPGYHTHGYHTFKHLVMVHKLVVEAWGCNHHSIQLAALFHDYGYRPKASGEQNIDTACRCLIDTFRMHIGYEINSAGVISQHHLLTGRLGSTLTDARIACWEALLAQAVTAVRATDYDRATPEAIAEHLPLIRADLTVLASAPNEYYAYSKAIRFEHKHVDRKDYIKGRTEALKSILTKAETWDVYTWQQMPMAWNEVSSLQASRSVPSVVRPRALYAGSFDPVHKGHLAVMRAAVAKGYDVVVTVLENREKRLLIPPSERLLLLSMEIGRLGELRDHVTVVSTPDGIDISYAMVLAGCNVLLRGMRNGLDTADEYGRKHLLKAEAGIETLLVRTDKRYAAYSSSALKELVRLRFPANGFSAPIRCLLDRHDLRISLLVGGIGTGKSTLAGKRAVAGKHVFLDLDAIAASVLSRSIPGLWKESVEERLRHFRSFKQYLRYMSRIKPYVLAELRGEILRVSTEFPALCSIHMQVNKLGLLWGDLLRMVNYNVVYMEDIGDAEAERRIALRGSSADTLRAVRQLEHHAPDFKSLKGMVEKKFQPAYAMMKQAKLQHPLAGVVSGGNLELVAQQTNHQNTEAV
jgi:pantetheine-phosphate adenylyltransferase